jgi:hypothetical protein
MRPFLPRTDPIFCAPVLQSMPVDPGETTEAPEEVTVFPGQRPAIHALAIPGASSMKARGQGAEAGSCGGTE